MLLTGLCHFQDVLCACQTTIHYMNIIDILLKEMEQEAQTTRKMLSLVPMDKPDWKPHVKSMPLKTLAIHIAELPSWVAMALTTDELDFASSPYEQVPVAGTDDLLKHFESCLRQGKKELAETSEEVMQQTWTLRNGEEIYSRSSKLEVIRMAFCQVVHHRAQLGVYLRLLDIPIPGSYGPSADQETFS